MKRTNEVKFKWLHTRRRLLNHLFSPNCTLEWTDDAFSTWLTGQKCGAGKFHKWGRGHLLLRNKVTKIFAKHFTSNILSVRFFGWPFPSEMFTQFLDVPVNGKVKNRLWISWAFVLIATIREKQLYGGTWKWDPEIGLSLCTCIRIRRPWFSWSSGRANRRH